MRPSTLRTWFIPAWCGDFRLEAHPDDAKRSILTVEDPTESDKARLVPFLAHARERGWVDALDGISSRGMSVLHVGASVSEAGQVMAASLFRPGEETWTALRVTGGAIELVNGTMPFDMTAPKASEAPTSTSTPSLPAKQPEAAVTVRAPRLGCPAPTPAERRASEVLRTFCTQREWDCWQQRSFIPVVGNASGRSYRIYHRTEAARLNMGHTVVDQDGTEVCMWDDTVPAEEEALALKLALQHREGWLLRQSLGGSRLGGAFRARRA